MRQDGEEELMSSRRCRQRHLTVHFNVSLRLIVALPPLVTLLNFSFFLLLALVSLFVALSIYESLTGAEWVEHLFDLFFSLFFASSRRTSDRENKNFSILETLFLTRAVIASSSQPQLTFSSSLSDRDLA